MFLSLSCVHFCPNAQLYVLVLNVIVCQSWWCLVVLQHWLANLTKAVGKSISTLLHSFFFFCSFFKNSIGVFKEKVLKCHWCGIFCRRGYYPQSINLVFVWILWISSLPFLVSSLRQISLTLLTQTRCESHLCSVDEIPLCLLSTVQHQLTAFQLKVRWDSPAPDSSLTGRQRGTEIPSAGPFTKLFNLMTVYSVARAAFKRLESTRSGAISSHVYSGIWQNVFTRRAGFRRSWKWLYSSWYFSTGSVFHAV